MITRTQLNAKTKLKIAQGNNMIIYWLDIEELFAVKIDQEANLDIKT